jgi:acyl transferase domain-containing protein
MRDPINRQAPVAIVGIGGVFPGGPELSAFWQNILHGRDAACETPPGRWAVDPRHVFDKTVGAIDRTYSLRACFIDPTPRKSAMGLNLDAELLARLDPSCHLLLQAGHEAFREARLDDVAADRMRVIIGNLALPTDSASELARTVLGRTFEEKIVGNAARTPARVDVRQRFAVSAPAQILAHALGITGGAFALDAACASSLYALKLGMDDLLAGRADAVLAGGLSRPDSLYTQMGFAQLRALSPTGVCTPFDAQADGLVVGEGCGILVLKRLDDALHDGDRIYTTIHGAGVSNDIGGSLLAPKNEGQLRAMRAAYRAANWQPSDVDLIECHATGTPVGDATEFASLCSLWGQDGWAAGQCVIGSVKSNIGHTLTAAGSAAVIKTLLAFQNKTLPPTANFSEPGANINLSASPFRVLTKPRTWSRRDQRTPRRAAVSAFGFGGINAHLLLEEWREPTRVPREAAALPVEIRSEKEIPQRVAVVGMDAWFGPWSTLREFQERVFNGADHTTPAAPRHWWGAEQSRWFRESGRNANDYPGYYIDELDVSPKQFRIPPKELSELLPQQVLMLEVAARALADASVDTQAHNGERTGVYIGLELDFNTTNYTFRWALAEMARTWSKKLGLSLSDDALESWLAELRDAAGPALTANRTMGGLGSIAPSRIAREFRFGGPSFAVAGGEASGLRATTLAIQALCNGELDCALVGAVDFAGDVRAALSAGEAGRILGEGAAAVVLKREEDAIRDGDRIYALIEAPSRHSERSEESRSPQTSTYVQEILRFAQNERLGETIGHAGAADGMARLVMTCLAMYQEIIPAAGNRPAQYWLRDRADGARRATVQVDGIELGLEEYTGEQPARAQTERLQPFGARREGLFVVEASNLAALSVALDRLRAIAERHVHDPIEDLARRWWQENGNDPRKAAGLAMVARNVTDLMEQSAYLRRWLDERSDQRLAGTAPDLPPALRDRIFYAPEPVGAQGHVAFVYPGSGNQYAGMGRELFAHWPEVLRHQDGENEHLASQFQPDLFWNDAHAERIKHDHNAALFGQVSLGAAVTDLVQQLGIRPRAVVGYSLGETAGLFAMRAWTERDAMLERVNRSTLFTEDLAGTYNAARKAWKLPSHKSVDWALGVIDRPAKVARAALKDHKKVYTLIVNTLHECVIGGDPHAVAKLVKKLDCEFFPLHGVTTVHCEVAKEVQEPYRALHVLKTTPPRGVKFYSGAWGTAYNVSEESAADSVLAQAIYGIDYPKMIEAAYEDGARVFIEMGPGASCSRMIGEILAGRPLVARSACYAGQDAASLVLRLAGQLAAERVPLDLSVLYGQETCAVGHHPARVIEDAVILKVGGDPFEVVVPAAPVAASPKRDETNNGESHHAGHHKDGRSPGHSERSDESPSYADAEAGVELAATTSKVADTWVSPANSFGGEANRERHLQTSLKVPPTLPQRLAADTTPDSAIAVAQAHTAFLQFSETLTQQYADALQFRMRLTGLLLDAPQELRKHTSHKELVPSTPKVPP